jgi:hypothetical protein
VVDSSVHLPNSEVVDNLQVCWTTTSQPGTDADWVIETSFTVPREESSIGRYELTAIEVNRKPAVFFYLIDRNRQAQICVATPDSAQPGSRKWQATALFPCDNGWLGSHAVAVENGVVRLLYTTADNVMFASCPENSILDIAKWNSTAVLGRQGMEMAMGFVESMPAIAKLEPRYFLGRAHGTQLEFLISHSEFPKRNPTWSVSVLVHKPAKNVSIGDIQGKPVLSFTTYDPDRLCYAFASKNRPQSSRDWRVCTVVEHNLLSLSEKEAAQRRSWLIVGAICGLILVLAAATAVLISRKRSSRIA